MNLKFDNAARLSEVVWNARLADMPRGENRAVLNRCDNGEPPFDEAKSQENNVEVNRNFLQGTRLPLRPVAALQAARTTISTLSALTTRSLPT